MRVDVKITHLASGELLAQTSLNPSAIETNLSASFVKVSFIPYVIGRARTTFDSALADAQHSYEVVTAPGSGPPPDVETAGFADPPRISIFFDRECVEAWDAQVDCDEAGVRISLHFDGSC